jgi:CheY-like chemotaxis protein
MEVNRTIEGTGLGMTITWNLLQIMGGDIFVESEPGEGTEFTVIIPQGGTDAPPLGSEVAEKLQQFRLNSLAQKKNQMLREFMPYGSVLVVDDMEANLYVAKGILSPYGLQIDTASSGFEAIDKIQSGKKYDVVFMDHMMPKMDGMETTTVLRKSIGYTGTIVALTADAVSGRSDFFLANGFDDFISKPINTRRLNDVLNKFIRDKQTPEVLETARRQHKTQQKDNADSSGKIPAGTTADTAAPDKSASDLLIEELSQIEDLNVRAGLGYIGDNRESYFGVLRFFSDKCDSYLEELDKALKGEIWGDYAIKIHALKGVCANIGAEKLSQRAAALEKASKAGDEESLAMCREETQPFSTDLCAFRDRLRGTSLFAPPPGEGEGKKPAGCRFGRPRKDTRRTVPDWGP